MALAVVQEKEAGVLRFGLVGSTRNGAALSCSQLSS